jgi:hypothetical protein
MRRAGPGGLAPALVLLALLATPTSAAELPRVFLSPAERAALTASRLAGRPLPSVADSAATTPKSDSRSAESAVASPSGTVPVSTAPVALAPRTTRVEGVTFGAGRNQAVWIGGQRIADGGYWSGQRVRVMRDGVQLVARDGRVRVLRVGMEVRP